MLSSGFRQQGPSCWRGTKFPSLSPSFDDGWNWSFNILYLFVNLPPSNDHPIILLNYPLFREWKAPKSHALYAVDICFTLRESNICTYTWVWKAESLIIFLYILKTLKDTAEWKHLKITSLLFQPWAIHKSFKDSQIQVSKWERVCLCWDEMV